MRAFGTLTVVEKKDKRIDLRLWVMIAAATMHIILINGRIDQWTVKPINQAIKKLINDFVKKIDR